MAIKISGTTVVDDSRNITNITTYNGYTPADEAVLINVGIGLTGGGDLSTNRTISADIASQVEAEAGIANNVLMTPERTLQAINRYGPQDAITYAALF